MRALLGVAIVVAVLAHGAALEAQPACGPAESLADAEQLYACGTRALTDERYAEAEAYLARSLERQASVRTAFNLAIALRNLGRARRALTLLRDLEAGRYGEVPAARRDSLARQIETNLASLATVVVSLPAGVASARVELDGVESQELAGADEARFVVEPGEHAILASAAGACMERAGLSVSRGEARSVRLVAMPCPSEEPAPTGATAATTAGADRGSDDGLALGLGIGIAVAVVAGAIVLGVVLGSGTDAPSCTGDRPCIETLVAPLRF